MHAISQTRVVELLKDGGRSERRPSRESLSNSAAKAENGPEPADGIGTEWAGVRHTATAAGINRQGQNAGGHLACYLHQASSPPPPPPSQPHRAQPPLGISPTPRSATGAQSPHLLSSQAEPWGGKSGVFGIRGNHMGDTPHRTHLPPQGLLQSPAPDGVYWQGSIGGSVGVSLCDSSCPPGWLWSPAPERLLWEAAGRPAPEQRDAGEEAAGEQPPGAQEPGVSSTPLCRCPAVCVCLGGPLSSQPSLLDSTPRQPPPMCALGGEGRTPGFYLWEDRWGN